MIVRSTILALLLVSLVAQRGGVYGYSRIWPPTLHQQRASYFVGRDVLSSSSSLPQRSASSSSMIEMKKGKANLPSHMRSQYKRSQEMEAYRQQMMESQVSKRYRILLFEYYEACTEQSYLLILSSYFLSLTHTRPSTLMIENGSRWSTSIQPIRTWFRQEYVVSLWLIQG